MKIAVCIKQVVTREWQLRVNDQKTWIRDQDAGFELNEPDAYALEEALRLKEKHGGEVIVCSAGPARAAQVIREALARGADRAVHVESDALAAADANSVAEGLAEAIKAEQVDLVLTGLQSDDQGFGQVGVVLAEKLGMPHATIIMEVQAADGTLSLVGYQPAARHATLYEGCVFPKKPNMLAPAEVVKQKPAWAEAFDLKKNERSQALLKPIHAGQQEEIRLRAAMMASVDEGIGMLFDALARTGQLDETFILFFGDNGYFFGEHGLGPERRFAYEEGIRSPFIARYPKRIRPGSRVRDLVICQDIAPTLIQLAGGRPGPQVQGRSLLPLLSGKRSGWRKSLLVEYWAENAMPWLIGMTYKAVRTRRYKYIRWINRSRNGELDELYDFDRDPYEISNVINRPPYRTVRDRLRRELRRLVADAGGL